MACQQHVFSVFCEVKMNEVIDIVATSCVLIIIGIPVILGLLMLPHYISKWRNKK